MVVYYCFTNMMIRFISLVKTVKSSVSVGYILYVGGLKNQFL